MSFGGWYVRRGRMSLQTWWMQYALPFLVLGTVAGITDSYQGFPPPASEGWSIYTYLGGPVSIAIGLALLIPTVSSCVARLHDRDHSAWWLLWLLLPAVGPAVLFVQNGFLSGTAGANRYGPPPVAEPDRVPA